jgi:hypothetical protein
MLFVSTESKLQSYILLLALTMDGRFRVTPPLGLDSGLMIQIYRPLFTTVDGRATATLFSAVDGICRAMLPHSINRERDAELQPPFGLDNGWKMQSYASPCSQ